MNNILPGMEAINAQPESKFAKELTAIFQTGIDERDKLADTDGVIPDNKVSPFIKMFKDKILPEYRRVFKKYTNVDIAQFVISRRMDSGFAVRMYVGDKSGWSAQILGQEFSGLGRADLWWINETPTTAEDMEKVSAAFSKETGYAQKNTVLLKKLAVDIYFDPYTAFLAKTCLHKGVPVLTAREIAAIQLHETGHMMSVIEHAADKYYRVTAYQKISKYFTDYAPFEEQHKYVKRQMDKQTANKADIPEYATKIVDLLDQVTTQYDVATMGHMWKIVFLVVMSPLYALVMSLNILGTLIQGRSSGQEVDLNDLFTVRKGTKYGDVKITSRNLALMERYADEFVSMHGYSGELASGLLKMYEYHFTSPMAGKSSLVYGWQMANAIWITMAIEGMDTGPGTYEDSYMRIKRLMQNTIQFFKSENLSDELVAFYLEDFERIDALMKKLGTFEKMKQTNRKLHGWIAKLSLANLVNIIKHGRLSPDYKLLMDQLDELQSPVILYAAKKLKQLAKS